MNRTIVGLTGAQLAEGVSKPERAPDMGMTRVGMAELEQLRMLVGDVYSILEAYMQNQDPRLPAAAKHLIDADRAARNGS